jgi:hypothetical protein
VVSSPVQLGGGFVNCAHGKLPVPAPATAEIVKNIPVKTGLVDYEATTPTGAAILAATVNEFSSKQYFKITATGYGIGYKDAEIPNVLRVYLAETDDESDVRSEDAVMLECNIDDMNPEWFDNVSNLLFEAGAHDVFISPIIMKKSRPANKLSVLCYSNIAAEVKKIIFTHTSSIGIREYPVRKNKLPRKEIIVDTEYGKIRVKQSYFEKKVITSKPEYDDCLKIARELGVSVREVYNAVMKKL